MNVETASNLVALRSAISHLVVRSTTDPESIEQPPSEDEKLLNFIREISSVSAAGSIITPSEALERSKFDPSFQNVTKQQ